MSRQVAEIIALARKLSLVEQWQVVHSILEELEKETLSDKLDELGTDILDDLNQDQKNRLAKAIEESEAGKTIPHEQVQAEIKKWLTK